MCSVVLCSRLSAYSFQVCIFAYPHANLSSRHSVHPTQYSFSTIYMTTCLPDSPQFLVQLTHYENMPMQYTEIFKAVKNENFQWKFLDIFLIFAQNIDCGYTLEPPRRGGSNEYPQSMFWSKNKKIGLPLHTPVLLYKSGV